MRLAIQALKNDGLTAADMYNCWLARRLIPLRSRAYYMWEYWGQNDCTRSTAVDWSEDEYRKVLAKVTTATFTSLDDGLQPFSEDRPAPQVSNCLSRSFSVDGPGWQDYLTCFLGWRVEVAEDRQPPSPARGEGAFGDDRG
jgi:hypothetical protein